MRALHHLPAAHTPSAAALLAAIARVRLPDSVRRRFDARGRLRH